MINNISFWTDLLADKCECLIGVKKDDKVSLKIILNCSQDNCNFSSLKNLFLKIDPPRKHELILSLLKTKIFTRSKIVSIISSVYKLSYNSSYASVANMLSVLKSKDIIVKENSEKILYID